MNRATPRNVIVRKITSAGAPVWGLFAAGDSVATAVFATKREAVALARGVVRGTDAEVIVQDRR